MDETLVGAIIGGAISGGVGIFIAWYTSRLKDNEWMKQNVYHKLYNWIESREENFLFNDQQIGANQTESQLTSSERVKLDKKIKEKFEAFIYEGKKWDWMWSTVYNRYTRRDNDILNDFIQPLKDANLIGPNGYITVVNGISADSFFYDFFLVLMNPSIKNADDLYQKMKEYNDKKNRFQPESLVQIKNEKPKFFDLLYDNLSSLRKRVLLDTTFEDLMKEGDRTREVLLELKKSLKRKL